MMASFDRSFNPCRTFVSWKHIFCKCVESDWFSIFILHLVFILNTPAVTLQIATRKNFVRFRIYDVQRGWPKSGTWGPGSMWNLSAWRLNTHLYKMLSSWVYLCWSCIKWGLDSIQRALATSSIVLCLWFFFKPHLHSQNLSPNIQTLTEF